MRQRGITRHWGCFKNCGYEICECFCFFVVVCRYNVNAMESLASAMEISSIGGRNAARLAAAYIAKLLPQKQQ